MLPTPALIVLNGASSSGKTSLARALQEMLPEVYLNFSIDAVLYSLPPGDLGRMIRGQRINRAGYDFPRLVRGHHAAIAGLLESGNALIADNALTDAALKADLARVARPFRSLWVGVHCDLGTLQRREVERGDRAIGGAAWESSRVHQGMTYDLEVDTTHASPAGCASAILEAVRRLRGLVEEA